MEAEAKASKAKLAPKKKADTPKKAAPAKISDGGWASLSPSALKRKTVTEISEFLEQNVSSRISLEEFFLTKCVWLFSYNL